ncbi:hypothetical protein [Parabacteroides distasonis]|uniref:hypothetical protein n=1 Tax=Parabacteroides distasonis TaxID=823 RepID=UPI001F358294|nr:hypothetical protein [Parabacteroides distasonis]MCE9060401.1 hypothetical protein [Parabacteroides distasonis]
MIKKFISVFIRWSIVKRYIQASFIRTDSSEDKFMDANTANYWVIYILTGKSDEQIEKELTEYQGK